LCFGGSFDDWTFFDRLVAFATAIFSYLARSSLKLSFGLLFFSLLGPLPPSTLWESSLSPSRRHSWKETWPITFAQWDHSAFAPIGEISPAPSAFWIYDNISILLSIFKLQFLDNIFVTWGLYISLLGIGALSFEWIG
jgi:hypothetical protein